VLVEHRNISNLMWTVREGFGMGPGEMMPVIAPFAFDICLFELACPLVSGATAMILGKSQILDLRELVENLGRVTMLHAVPSLMRELVDYLLRQGRGESWRGIKAVFVGGDAVPPGLLSGMEEAFPEARRHVLYGPTEGTVICSSYEVLKGSRVERQMIGKPLSNMKLGIYDREKTLVPVGVSGEIYIGGRGVTRGYQGREELTREKYVEKEGERYYRTGDLGRYLSDGNIEYLGRADHQVKIRGHRVEPGEVEAMLSSHPSVRESVVIAREDERKEKQLIAYVVREPKSGKGLKESEGSVGEARIEHPPESGAGESVWPSQSLRDYLSKYLPEYMVPSRFVAIEKLPLTANGKVDRRALPPVEWRRPETGQEYIAPRTP